MADLEIIRGQDNGNPPDTLRQAYPKINRNFQNINNGLTGHIASKVAHKAEDITYTGDATGSNVKQAIDGLDTRVDGIVAQSGNDNTEIVDARGGYTVLSDRLNVSDKRLTDITINVKSFGAKGDGLTDDTNAIQSAIDSGAFEILLPAGVYITSKPLVIKRGQRLIGKNGIMAVNGGDPQTFTAKGTVIKKITSNGYSGLHSYGRDGVLIDLSNINAVVILCTSDYDYESMDCSIENIGFDCDTLIPKEMRPIGIYAFRGVACKFSNINMHNMYRGVDGEDFYKNHFSSVHVWNAVDCGFVLRVTSNTLTSCHVTNARVGYYVEGVYQHIDACAADNIQEIAYWVKGAQSIKLTNCAQEMCSGNKIRIENADSVTVDTCFASGSDSLVIPENYSGVGITNGLPNGQRDYTIFVDQSNVVFQNTNYRYDSTTAVPEKQQYISSDSRVEYYNTLIGRQDRFYYDWVATSQSEGLGKIGQTVRVYYTNGTTDIEIGSMKRFIIGPLLYILGRVYVSSIAGTYDSMPFRLKFRDESAAAGSGFPNFGNITGTPDWEATNYGSMYCPLQLTRAINPTGQPKVGGIDYRDNCLYFYDADNSVFTVAKAKTFAGANADLRFFGFHLRHIGA